MNLMSPSVFAISWASSRIVFCSSGVLSSIRKAEYCIHVPPRSLSIFLTLSLILSSFMSYTIM